MAEGEWSKTGRTMPIHGCFQSALNFQIRVASVCNSNGKQGFGRLPRQVDRALLDSERGVTRATCMSGGTRHSASWGQNSLRRVWARPT